MLNDRLIQFVNIDLHDVKVVVFLIVTCIKSYMFIELYLCKRYIQYIILFSLKLCLVLFSPIHANFFSFCYKGYCLSAGSKKAF